MEKIKEILRKLWLEIRVCYRTAKSWLGTEGLISMETAFSLMMIIGVWFNWHTCAFSILLACMIYQLVNEDDTRWHKLLCDCIGILFGIVFLLFYAI